MRSINIALLCGGRKRLDTLSMNIALLAEDGDCLDTRSINIALLAEGVHKLRWWDNLREGVQVFNYTVRGR